MITRGAKPELCGSMCKTEPKEAIKVSTKNIEKKKRLPVQI